MRARGLSWYMIVSCITASILAGCGGSSGGYGGGAVGSGNGNGGASSASSGGYGVPPPPAVPTATIISPAQATTINLGEPVTLQWTSTDATTCSASSSSDTGGSLVGVQNPSDSVAIAPTATGEVTYTVTCTGAGGSTSATTAAVTVNPAILNTLAPSKSATIGSTFDLTVNPAPNPYGLTIASATAGVITQGDLIVCNFNDTAGNEGNGTTLVGLHPTPGSTPYIIADDPALTGCNALAALPDGSISAAAWTSNQNPLIVPNGAVNTIATPFSTDTFKKPWGEVYVPPTGANLEAIYVSNYDGSIDRISLNGDLQSAFTEIATGFCGNGQPGSIYAPSGLTYDPDSDTLYIVDTSSYSVVGFKNVSSIGTDGIVVAGQCPTVNPAPASAYPTPLPTFSGPSASSAWVLAHGAPFVAPLSAALLKDGNLIVTNSDINLDPTQTPNLAFQISPWVPGGFVGQPVQLEASPGSAGALFGVAAAVDAQNNQIIYFNDDFTNSVMAVSQ